MRNEIQTINDFRNAVVDANFDYRVILNELEIQLIQCLKDTFKIPDEANIRLTYEIDGELKLISDIRLNIHNEKGFELIREECHSVLNHNSFFSIIEPKIEYMYIFNI